MNEFPIKWKKKECEQLNESDLEDQEVPGLDENAEFLQLLAVLGQSHNFIINAVL